ncbi:MAG TPA: DUF159 family protein [Rhodocyclaceae bacterium]|nr:MAG: hypothetical protein AUK49_13410 [Betaproteobacteria bacterium CG2_30_68_42]PJA57094.1 MAG: DUF159 family protein [Rhodocyclales bacterium CG_4_9_14_3_um_filter_68_10]HCX32690.1 DUF159 family protein [Rhodocyclaceae bacterium]
MCGRIDLHTPAAEIARLFRARLAPDAGEVRAGWNIAPGRTILAILGPGDARTASGLAWGFVPRWARDPDGVKPINARADTAFAKPMFREAIRRRRCLIPVDGFYEWKREGGTKLPYYFRLARAEPFALGGLWEVRAERGGEGGVLRTCAILTTGANELMAPVHDRMPVIVPPEAQALWLSADAQGERELAPLLAPFDAARMRCWRVGRRVNDAANDGEDLVQPLPG